MIGLLIVKNSKRYTGLGGMASEGVKRASEGVWLAFRGA